MKNIFGFFLIFTLIACQTTPKRELSEFESLQAELTHKLDSLSRKMDINGFGVALVSDEGVLFQNGFGVANAETGEEYTEFTLQAIASVSKTFIGIAVMKAQELGKLNLDDPISKYLSYPIENPNFKDVPITIRQLVTHTSSITDNEEYLYRSWILNDTVNLAENLKMDIGECKFSAPDTRVSLEDFVKNVLTKKGKWYRTDAFTEAKPGAKYSYSNMGATLAALIVEKAVAMPFDEFTEQYIFKPLGMTSTGWGLKSVDKKMLSRLHVDRKKIYPLYELITYPDGGVITSSKDMSLYILDLLKGYNGKGTLLSQDAYKEYFTPQLTEINFDDRDTNRYSDEYNTGIHMGFSSNGSFGHYGGDPGISSSIWFYPSTNTGRYIVINTDWSSENQGKDQYALYSLIDEYLEKLKNKK